MELTDFMCLLVRSFTQSFIHLTLTECSAGKRLVTRLLYRLLIGVGLWELRGPLTQPGHSVSITGNTCLVYILEG